MLTKNEIAAQIEEMTGVKPVLTKRILDALATVASEHVASGEDLTVPGIVSFKYDYRAPQKKGSRWKKGDTRINNITKEESIAEADSPPVTPRIRLKANPVGLMGKVKPSTKPDSQREFMKTKPAKAVVRRKG
jgi:nucleoid DNA-binding protein